MLTKDTDLTAQTPVTVYSTIVAITTNAPCRIDQQFAGKYRVACTNASVTRRGCEPYTGVHLTVAAFYF